jgi:hypothetical protein
VNCASDERFAKFSTWRNLVKKTTLEIGMSAMDADSLFGAHPNIHEARVEP